MSREKKEHKIFFVPLLSSQERKEITPKKEEKFSTKNKYILHGIEKK
jgi:hypothetical protein